MPNRTEARSAKAALTHATGNYRHCACSRLYSLRGCERCYRLIGKIMSGNPLALIGVQNKFDGSCIRESCDFGRWANYIVGSDRRRERHGK